jgi:hypothetical protein
MLADRAQAMRRVCFDPEPSETDLELLGSRERWLVYRNLVRNRLTHIVGAAMRRTKQAVGDEAFQCAIDEWLSSGGPRTRYLRHVPCKLATLAISVWQSTEPAWIADLTRYEIAIWEVRNAPPDPASHQPFAFDRNPVLRHAMKILRLDHPVHQTPAPASGYRPERTLLCVYRDAEHKPATRKLNALAADLLESWKRGDETIAESVERVAAEHGTAISPIFVEKLSTLIADFILGGHSPPPKSVEIT